MGSDGSPAIIFNDKNGEARIKFALDIDEFPALAFQDKDGGPRVVLRLMKDDMPFLALCGEDEKILFCAPESENDNSE